MQLEMLRLPKIWGGFFKSRVKQVRLYPKFYWLASRQEDESLEREKGKSNQMRQ